MRRHTLLPALLAAVLLCVAPALAGVTITTPNALVNPTITGHISMRASTADNYAASLGSEMLTNGLLTSDLSSWSISGDGTGWTYSSGAALHTVGSTQTFSQTISTTNNTSYFIDVIASDKTAGTLTLTMSNMLGTFSIRDNGENGGFDQNYLSFAATATGSSILTFTPSDDYNGKILSVSMKPVTGTTEPLISIYSESGMNLLDIRGTTYSDTLLGRGPSGGAFDHTLEWGSMGIGIGYKVLENDVAGYINTVVGGQAMQKNVSGYGNSAFGQGALYDNVGGDMNSAFGWASQQYGVAGVKNSSFGTYSMYHNSTGSYNSAFGWESLANISTGNYNNAYGVKSLINNTTGSHNIGIGYFAIGQNTTGSDHIGIGKYAGFSLASGDRNIFVGTKAGYLTTSGTANILIGQNVDAPITTGSGQLNIGNLIYGTGVYATDSVSSAPAGGSVGIGTASPESLFEVQAAEGLSSILTLDADDGDDATDTWKIRSDATTNSLILTNGTTDVFSISSAGAVTATSTIKTTASGTFGTDTNNISLEYVGGFFTGSAALDYGARIFGGANQRTANAQRSAVISTTYNQASGTAANTDLFIQRIETALGSGAQKFVSFQAGAAGTTEYFSVSNIGIVVAGGGSADAVMCWKADAKTMGYCSGGLLACGTCL